MYPPFWFSTLESKISYAHTTGRKFKINNIWKSHLISQSSLWEANRKLIQPFLTTPPQKPHVNALHQLYQGFTDWKQSTCPASAQPPQFRLHLFPGLRHIRPHGHQQGHTLVRDPQVLLDNCGKTSPISDLTMSPKVNLKPPDGPRQWQCHGCMKGCKESRGGQRGFSGWSMVKPMPHLTNRFSVLDTKYSRVNKDILTLNHLLQLNPGLNKAMPEKPPYLSFPKQPLSLYCQLHSTEGLKSHCKSTQ